MDLARISLFVQPANKLVAAAATQNNSGTSNNAQPVVLPARGRYAAALPLNQQPSASSSSHEPVPSAASLPLTEPARNPLPDRPFAHERTWSCLSFNHLNIHQRYCQQDGNLHGAMNTHNITSLTGGWTSALGSILRCSISTQYVYEWFLGTETEQTKEFQMPNLVKFGSAVF